MRRWWRRSSTWAKPAMRCCWRLREAMTAACWRKARRMAGREIEGMLLVGIDTEPELRTLLDERRIPYVAVEGDYLAAGENRGTLPLALGHRSLAYLDEARAGRDRRRRCSAVCATAVSSQPKTLPPISVFVRPAPDHRAELRNWLAAGAPPTALVCADDLLALAALQECAALGIAFPGQVSIVGCGDLAFARHATPTLSTLRLPGLALGRAAVDRLQAQRGGAQPRFNPSRSSWSSGNPRVPPP